MKNSYAYLVAFSDFYEFQFAWFFHLIVRLPIFEVHSEG